MLGYVLYEICELFYYSSKIIYNSISYIYNYKQKQIKNIDDNGDIKYKVM